MLVNAFITSFLLDSITTIEDELQQASKNSLTKINSLEEEIKAKREHLIELKISFKAAIERTALHAVNSETGEHLSPKVKFYIHFNLLRSRVGDYHY